MVKSNAELPPCFRYLSVFLFLSVHNIEIKLVFGEFVIKYVVIIFDDFEERNEIQSVGRGTRKRC